MWTARPEVYRRPSADGRLHRCSPRLNCINNGFTEYLRFLLIERTRRRRISANLMYRNFKVEANCVAHQATLVSVVPTGLSLGGTLYPPINWWASSASSRTGRKEHSPAAECNETGRPLVSAAKRQFIAGEYMAIPIQSRAERSETAIRQLTD